MSHDQRLLLASRNAAKVGELQRILTAVGVAVEVMGLAEVEPYPEPVEDQPDFCGNALLKARAGFAATGIATVADDSGLCVEALNGMPGVLSARWAGSPSNDSRNNELLLAQLADVPSPRRGAHFECCVAFVYAGGEHTVTGTMPGRLLDRARGVGGFGYDPLFVPDEQPGVPEWLTAAQLSPQAKDAISHRGKALREMAPIVAAALGAAPPLNG